MAQPQRGPVRSEVSDLQNIVDRLDLLMGSSADASAGSAQGLGETAREQIHDALDELTNRISSLEREAEELRTLVNHLMTIATWQAKVTATLVGEEAQTDASEDQEVHAGGQPEHQFVERVGRHVEPRRPDEPQPHPRRAEDAARATRSATPTLDDDIDDILGTDREPPTDDGPPPPDFGI